MKKTLYLLVVLLLVSPCSVSLGQNFSVENGHSDIVAGFIPGDDILIPGFLGPPLPVITGSGVPATVPPIDVNGFTYGMSLPIGDNVFFSVDGAAIGAVGSALSVESGLGTLPGEQNADVFFTDLSVFAGTNVLAHDGNGAPPGAPPGFLGPLGVFEGPVPPPPPPPFLPTAGEGVDGYDARFIPGSSVYWTVNPVTITVSTPYLGLSAADVFLSAAAPAYSSTPALFASETALGLTTATAVGDDNLDALEVYDGGAVGVFDAGDVVLFSLDPTSASLSTPGSSLFGFSPGDVFIVSPGFAPSLFIPAGALGLGPTDNLNALSVVHVIPEPSVWWCLGCLALVLSLVKFRRTRVGAV